MIQEKIDAIKASFTADTSEDVEALRVKYLGKKAEINKLFSELRNLADEKRADAGALINNFREFLTQEISNRKDIASAASLQKELHKKPIDVSLPVDTVTGSLHPVTLMKRELVAAFHKLGFIVYDGPEIDSDFYNFSALNFPADHPARDMQDTFFTDSGEVLRTHTSNIQIHAMLNEKPPLRIVAPGRTFRCDSDLTHTPMFHQMEALVVDEGIGMGHMKGIIEAFLKEVYGPEAKLRLRPSFFPFVEPGAEVDMQCVSCRGSGCRICSETGWLEIGGCGLVHPNVFESVEYDSEKWSGFAFGFGIDRMAMLKYNLSDLRTLFEGYVPFLNQFPPMSRS